MSRRLDRRWLAAIAAAGAMAGVAALADHSPALALINESPSLPKGVYLRQFATTPASGVVVATLQPVQTRSYLARSGMPADVLLLKRVAATGGDTVCRRGGRLFTPDRSVVVQDHDRSGLALPSWRGCRRLAPDELFLLGDTASSFDSRYFGPVRHERVIGVYREVLTW